MTEKMFQPELTYLQRNNYFSYDISIQRKSLCVVPDMDLRTHHLNEEYYTNSKNRKHWQLLSDILST